MRQYQGTTNEYQDPESTRGYQYTALVPEKTVFIYSRHAYAKINLLNRDGSPAQGVRIQGVVQIGARMFNNEYRYTDTDGNVTFDFAAILQTMKNDRDKELPSLAYERSTFAAWQMSVYYIRFYIGGEELRSASTSYELVNGQHDNIEDWWTKDRRLKYWVNYPFTFDFTNQEQVELTDRRTDIKRQISVPYIETSMTSLLVRFNPASVGVRTPVTIKNLSYPGIAVENGIVIGTDNAVTLDVEQCPASDRKTYLRWLSTHGEVFYWLFDNISESVQVKTETYRRTMTDDTFTGGATNYTRDNGIIRDCSAVKTRNIATEQLDSGYYDLVASIGDSVAVDMYLGEDRWQRVNVADGTYSKDIKHAARSKRNRIALTIEISER